jgi:ATP-binding cassette subfamily B protein
VTDRPAPEPARRRWLAPEVVQSSAMDCGPASLKCLLEGFGVHAAYGRLREACQTDVDGTSIDVIEDVARQLGLDAEQIMLPVDHLLLAESDALPALVVSRLPSGVTHFLVAWRRHGPLVQVMDPAVGRRWMTAERFKRQLYVHQMPVAAAGWREWAGSDEMRRVLERRLGDLGVARAAARAWIERAHGDPSWRSLAALDAAVRMASTLQAVGAVGRGDEATRLCEAVLARVRDGDDEAIPDVFWSVRPAAAAGDTGELALRGAVLVRVRGRATESASALAERPLSAELVAALAEKPVSPAVALVRLLREDGLLAPAALVLALALSALGVAVQALLLRGALEVGRHLGIPGQRLGAAAALVAFVGALLLLEWPVTAGLLRMGRHLETRLRLAFVRKLPRLHDRYLQSRLASDMAERSHAMHGLRQLPALAGNLLRSFFSLLLTAAGIAWLDPASAPLAAGVAALAVVLPILTLPVLSERDLRQRTHAGAISRFYLDALLGLVPVRTHGAERAVRREHEGLLSEWARAGYSLQRAAVSVAALLSLAGMGLSAWLVAAHLGRNGETGALLLLVYWALELPVHGADLAQLVRQYPTQRNLALRLLEPLGAPERDGDETARACASEPEHRGVAIALERVSVVAGGQPILHDLDLAIAPGEHVALVGPSGAGKSSLVGLLLGWHRPATGLLTVDGAPLEGVHLDRLRERTAWVEPATQLFHRSLFDNLLYGAAPGAAAALPETMATADLRALLERLPQGLQTRLGEGGGLVSGGEGMRVRLGRALMRPDARLVLLDEAFRGLARAQRHELLERVRARHRAATLVCVTHDVAETLAFARVLVVDGGRIVEDGVPEALAARDGSRYASLLAAERAAHAELWSHDRWRRLRVEDGRLQDSAAAGGER